MDEQVPDHLFKVGNAFWKKRLLHGRPPKYDNPEDLTRNIIEYFDWATANSIKEERTGFFEGDGCRITVDKMRPFTLQGLTIHLGISMDTWYEWHKTRDDLSETLKWADTVIWEQKFTGAATGQMNPGIIARQMGLAEKKEIQNLDQNGDKTGPIGHLDNAIAVALRAVEKAREQPADAE